ncbi:hypothetical protein J4427_00295 [Candidatus Woesearchaeota archaeon]|nr:hypothetical protein [Candidatus Woesearchaeota archaeon]
MEEGSIIDLIQKRHIICKGRLERIKEELYCHECIKKFGLERFLREKYPVTTFGGRAYLLIDQNEALDEERFKLSIYGSDYPGGPYQEMMGVLRGLPNSEKGFTYEEAKKRLRVTPGLFFGGRGMTLVDVFSTVSSWGWIENKGGKIYLTDQGKNAAIPYPAPEFPKKVDIEH